MRPGGTVSQPPYFGSNSAISTVDARLAGWTVVAARSHRWCRPQRGAGQARPDTLLEDEVRAAIVPSMHRHHVGLAVAVESPANSTRNQHDRHGSGEDACIHDFNESIQ